MEIDLVNPKIEGVHTRALDCGATEITPPCKKPWGQHLSYVRAPDRTLLEICTPVQNSSQLVLAGSEASQH